jgi:hypothetical protein
MLKIMDVLEMLIAAGGGYEQMCLVIEVRFRSGAGVT